MLPSIVAGLSNEMTVSSPVLEDVPCPMCHEGHRRTLYNDRRIGGSLGELPVTVVQCGECGFLFNSPRPNKASLDSYYSDNDLSSGQIYTDETASGHYPKLHAQRAAFLAQLLCGRRGGRLLDLGCGNGGFLQAVAVQLPGWELNGLELSESAVSTCRSRGLRVTRGAIGTNVLTEQSFDAISMISVLEHLPQPAEALAWCRQRLVRDGLLFLEVPDSLQPELSLTGFFNLEHIVHFTPGSLSRMLRGQNFSSSLRDPTAAGVIRLVSGNELALWGATADPIPADDREAVCRAILDYAVAERELISGLRQRVGGLLADWRRAGLRVAIYGAGIHSAQLAGLVELQNAASFFIDGDSRKQGTRFLGLPVFAPERLTHGDIDAVLISSNRFVDEMVRTVQRFGGPGIELRTCYE